jgi:hypothetical protein
MSESGGFDSSNPQTYQATLSKLAAVYPDIAPYVAAIAQQGDPLQTFQSVNAGGRTYAGGFNPRGGKFDPGVYEHTLDPTTKYEQDAATNRTGMTEGGANSRNAANIGLQRDQLARLLANDETAKNSYGAPMQDARGQFVFPRQSDGTLKQTGTLGVPPVAKGQGQPKDIISSLTAARKQMVDDYSGQPYPGMEGKVQQIDAQIAAMIQQGGGQLPVQDTEVPMIPPSKALSQAQYQYLRSNGMTDEQIAQYGYTLR